MPAMFTGWKTLQLDNLKVPVSAFYQPSLKGLNPVVYTTIGSTEVEIDYGEASIFGHISPTPEDIVTIKSFGVGDLTMQKYNGMLAVLAKSTGHLIARVVFDDGDSVVRLTVHDGLIKQIELT